MVVEAALHAADDFRVPILGIVLRFCAALCHAVLQNHPAVGQGCGELRLPVGGYRIRIKGMIVISLMSRIGIEHEAFPECFVDCNEHGNESFVRCIFPGILVSAHDRIIVRHRREIGTLAVEIRHQRLGRFGRRKRRVVKALSGPILVPPLDDPGHFSIIVFIKRKEQIRFVLNLIRKVPLLAYSGNGMDVDIHRIVRRVLVKGTVVVAGKVRAALVED